jgi:hypothetical protein
MGNGEKHLPGCEVQRRRGLLWSSSISEIYDAEVNFTSLQLYHHNCSALQENTHVPIESNVVCKAEAESSQLSAATLV